MSKKEFQALTYYQATMSIAAQMLDKGIISNEQYDDFEQKMLAKYRPIYGSLFSDRR